MVNAAQQNAQSAPTTAERLYVAAVAQAVIRPELPPGPLEPVAEPVDLELHYRKLLNRLYSAAPVEGYARAEDIGPLTPVDIRAVLYHAPEIRYAAANSDTLSTQLDRALGTRPALTVEVATEVGIAFYAVLLADVREHLKEEVQAEIDADADAQRGDESDEIANAALFHRELPL